MVMKIVRAVPLVLALVGALLLTLPHGAMAQDSSRFVSVIDDLPLMNGLIEVGEGVEFATPQGRIVEATASGALSRKAVLAFYSNTLPQLGWVQGGETRFVREGETLDLVLSEKDGALSVRFSLAPSNQ
jgi:hypothetical protein